MSGVVLPVAYCAAALVAGVTAAAAHRVRAVVPAGTPLFVATAGSACWSVAAAVTARVDDSTWVPLLASVGVAGQCLIVLGYLGVSEVVAGRTWRPSRRVALLLCVEPALVAAALLTDPWLHLLFDGVHRGADGSWQVGFGGVYLLHIAYNYVVALSGAARGIRDAHRRAGFTPRVTCWLVGMTAPPLVANAVGMLVLRDIDVTLLGTIISGVIAYSALTRRSLELLPVARAHLVDTLADGVVVVDRYGYVADANAVGKEMIVGTAPWITDPIGVELDSIDPTFPPLAEVDADFVFVSERLERELEMRTRVLHDRSGAFAGWVVIARDVTEYRSQQRALEAANQRLREQIATIDRLRADLAEQALRDALTGLHNRRHLMNALAAAEREHTGPLSVALVDVDHFKQINDRYGHAAGDRVLVAVGQLLASGAGPSDVLVRYGGEEFVLLLPGVTGDAAHQRVDGLRRRVGAAPLEIAGRTVAVSFSAGIASGVDPVDGDALLEAADHALYAAKRNGRDRVEIATSVR